MKSSGWKDIAELVGITGIVASLFFVGLQMSQTREVALSELAVAEANNYIELTAIIGDHAEIWAKGNSGADLNSTEAAVYNRILRSTEEISRSAFRRNSLFDQDLFSKINTFIFASFLHRNPGARRAWTTRVDQTNRGLELVEPKLGSAIRGNPWQRAVFTYLDRLDDAQE